MGNRHKRRGISLGTIVMLVITVFVTCTLAFALPRLRGDAVIQIDADKMLQALALDQLPELALSDIPIQLQQTITQPTAIPAVVHSAAPVATATAAPTATPAPAVFTITATGSIMVESSVRQGAWLSEAGRYDFTPILTYMKPALQADLCLTTLENIIDDTVDYTDVITTGQMVSMLSEAGVDAVALGFPKVLERGMDGLQATVNALRGKGMAVLGVHTAEADTQAPPTLMNLGGVKVAVMHYTSELSSASKKKAGSASAYAAPLANADEIAADVAAARANGAQVVIISLNWGEDDKATPTKAQQTLAQAIAAAGADVIIGTGAKALQPVVWLDAKRPDGTMGRTLCAYNLGVLLSEGRTDKNVASAVLQLEITVQPTGGITFTKLACTPTYAWRYKEDNAYRYFVVPSAEAAPDGMSKSQIESKERAHRNVQKILADSPLTVPQLITGN